MVAPRFLRYVICANKFTCFILESDESRQRSNFLFFSRFLKIFIFVACLLVAELYNLGGVDCGICFPVKENILNVCGNEG